jgi:hypothetical protein
MSSSRSERPAARLFHAEQIGPLLVLRFPEVVDAEAIDAMMATFDRAHRRGQRFASVLDATETRRLPGPREREALAAWLAEPMRRQLEREQNIGSALVNPSGIVRAFVAAIYFVRKPASPQHWVATLQEGVEWACARLVEAGVPLPPEVERVRADAATYGRFAARR